MSVVVSPSSLLHGAKKGGRCAGRPSGSVLFFLAQRLREYPPPRRFSVTRRRSDIFSSLRDLNWLLSLIHI